MSQRMSLRAPRTRLICAAMFLVLAASATVTAGSAVAATKTTPYGAVTLTAPRADAQALGRWAERTAAPHADYNADGVPDLFVGDPSEDVGNGPNAVTDQGRVFLLSGKSMASGTTSVLRTFNSPEPQASAHFGFFISVPGDLNGDGKPDIVIGTDAQNTTAAGVSCQSGTSGCNTRQGKAWAFSGATGALLYALNNPRPQPQARFGSRIGRAGDVNGDGVPDLIVGASGEDSPEGCSYDANGQPLDTLPDGCHKGQGQAFIFSGANGQLIRTLGLPDQVPTPPGSPCQNSCGSFGLAVQGPGDDNGDGVPDQLVDAGSYNYSTTSTPPGAPCASGDPGCNDGQGRMYLFSGSDGSLIRRIDDPEPQSGAVFGFQDVTPQSPGDVGSVGSNGAIGAKDGYADIYGNGFLQNAPLTGQGKAWVFDGKTGQVLYSLNDPTPEAGGQFGFSMAGTTYNSDSFTDLYIGQSPHHVSGSTGSGGSYVFGGHKDGLLKALELPANCVQPSTPSNLGPNLGWTVSAPGDLNGDGEPDYIAGAPFTDVGGNQDQGLLFVFLSNPAPGLPTPCT